jgi:hypothetical protein
MGRGVCGSWQTRTTCFRLLGAFLRVRDLGETSTTLLAAGGHLRVSQRMDDYHLEHSKRLGWYSMWFDEEGKPGPVITFPGTPRVVDEWEGRVETWCPVW